MRGLRWGIGGMDHTLERVIGMDVHTLITTIPVNFADVVPIRAGGESRRRMRGCRSTREGS
jgi:hypothetical protein